MTDQLEPIAPDEAVQMYLRERRPEVASSTLQSHEYRLKHFVRWCAQKNIDNLNDLSGRDLHRYKLWRQEDGDLAKASLKTQMDTVRVFARFCESIDAVAPQLHEKVLSPTLSGAENQRDVMLEHEQAEDILSYLGQFNYASLEHVLLLLLWRTGARAGGVRALDVGDYDDTSERLHVRHRDGTPLKNKEDGERYITIRAETCSVIGAWLSHSRPDVTDDLGREPLLATNHGRPHISTVRDIVYRWTRPCQYGAGCPVDRDPDQCEAADHGHASKCPPSVSSHAIRRGSITHHLSEDVPEKVVSDRMNVGQEVLDKHYDQRTEEVKVEQRRRYLDDL